MTTKDIKRARKAYRHYVTDSLNASNGTRARRKVSMRKRAQYFESFPIQVRRAVIVGV